ncbi:MAG TPA: tetratricopeptide repeat protein [Rhizomicrobium sp.]|jgi:localization factor PodJL|nr:tetratricopeptide repeat protein [Rhizomicrobium sp.]
MQPELPWNIAGIPAETREAVRAAARREGLSLGEWMTRQILGGFPDASVNGSGDRSLTGFPEHSTLPAEAASLGERPEVLERTIARVNALAERLSRVELQVQSDPMREAVKALHQGLSRAAEDIAGAANSSGRRLDEFEQRLSGIMSRLEETERANASVIGGIEQTLRELAARVEAADRRNDDAIRELSDPQSASNGSGNSAAASAGESADALASASHDTSSSAALGEAFAASEGFLAQPISLLSAARFAANGAGVEKTTSAAQSRAFPRAAYITGETPSAQARRKRLAVAASIFAAAGLAALGGVALTGGTDSTTPHAAPVSAVSHQPHRTSAMASKGATAALAEGHRGAPRTQITTAVKTDVAAVVPSLAAGTATRTAVAMAAKAPAPVNTAAVSATPNAPGQRIAALANMGNPRAQLLLGVTYLEGNGAQVNEAEAARWLARAAQQGEPLAQYRLGTLYERGRGVRADPKLATHWYGLAAMQGNLKAMHNLAVAFAQGSGTPKNESQAALWFARAANLGLADSQFNLAVLYERGMGVKQSLAEAYKWYLIAAAQGDGESKSRAEVLATQLKDSERAAGQRAAAVFRQQPLTPAANSLPILG